MKNLISRMLGMMAVACLIFLTAHLISGQSVNMVDAFVLAFITLGLAYLDYHRVGVTFWKMLCVFIPGNLLLYAAFTWAVPYGAILLLTASLAALYTLRQFRRKTFVTT